MQGSAYDVHPYLLLNLSDQYDGMSTYAHEWGHAMHSLLAKHNQPYELANYATFTAEIASTANEQLLFEHMLRQAKTKDEKLFYLGQQMENIRGTFFRQAMFAEFELKLHEMAEAGEGLSGKRFSEVYYDILTRYHGPKVTIDPAYAMEWAYVSHFFRNFYVYQYATSITAGVAFARRIKLGGAKEAERYLGVLKAGGSDYPTEILRKAGLDMGTPEPYRALVASFKDILDQAEALLA
jgi:oligoendopeptidase F